MKANELRIGNLVECDALRDTYKDRIPYFGKHIHAVHSACVDFVKLELGDKAIQKVEIFAVKPIPLTEYWLLKFGFELCNRSTDTFQAYWFGENPLTMDWMIEIKTIGNGFFYRNGHFKVEYVHQLQNLYFALTGVELPLTAP